MDFEIVIELNLVLQSAALGAALMAAYDLLRVWRRIFSHGKKVVVAEDIVFWIVAGIAIFLLLDVESQGGMRAYAIVAVAIGMFLFENLFGRWFIKFINFLLKPLQKCKKHYRIKREQSKRKQREV